MRRAFAKELPACAELFARVAAETFTWRDPVDMTAASFLEDAAWEEVTVAVEGGALLGLLALYRPDAFVHSLFVERRGRGVGPELLHHVRDEVDAPLTLKVETANIRAVNFYLREGFWPVDRGVDGRGPWIRMSR